MRSGSFVLLLSVAVLAAAVMFATGCGEQAREDAFEPNGGLTARQVLERSIEDLMSLESYRYRGTSRMTVSGNDALNSESRFDTVLQLNEEGALDGHMVVTSRQPGGSYETYSWRGTEYTRLEGGDWYRVDRSGGGSGYGMVSLDARRILADFAELVEEVTLVEETASRYVILLAMGPGFAPGSTAETTMTITVDKRKLRMLRASMTSLTPATPDTPEVTAGSMGAYSDFNVPMDIEPPCEALEAPHLQQ